MTLLLLKKHTYKSERNFSDRLVNGQIPCAFSQNCITMRNHVVERLASEDLVSAWPKKVDRAFQRLTRGSRPARGRVSGPGRYGKGHKKTGGRTKGTPNRLTAEIKETIIQAFTELGADGHGKDGLKGFIKRIGREDLKTSGMLLRAVLPMQINTSINTSVNVKYKTLDEAMEEARKLGLPERRVFELTDGA
jgi:hypothetical protein